jgi:sugar lactone lactonase YvrE
MAGCIEFRYRVRFSRLFNLRAGRLVWPLIGLAMRAGESALYVIQTTENNILRLKIKADGRVGETSVFAQDLEAIPDGMAFAANGDLLVIVGGTETIYRISPTGHTQIFAQDPTSERLRGLANCAFGGPYLDQLFITNLIGGHISRIANVDKGQPLFHQR